MGRCHATSALLQTAPLLLLAAVILQAIPAAQSAALIVRYTDAAVQQVAAMAAAAASPASVPLPAAAAAAAKAAAAARGESRAGQQRVAALAAATAEVVPAISALSDRASSQAAKLGLKVQRKVPLTTVFKGAVLEFSSSSSSSDVMQLKQQLEKDPLIQKVWVSSQVKLPTPVKSSPATGAAPLAIAAAAPSTTTAYSSSAVATGLQALQQRHPDLDGTGTLVCVIDTGINYRLGIFGPCTAVGQPFGSCRVVTGYDFVGDLYNGGSGGPPAVGDNDPNDCYGHGTEVASVATTANGIAPNASIGAYRVFGCTGTSTDSVIIPAIDRAVRDGCHIINLSLSSGSGYAEGSPYTDVMAAAWQQGVVVVKSAGNDGDAGWFQSDVTVAVGSAAIGSVGGWSQPLNSVMMVSDFSSFGPNPELTLGPHACAPGARIPVISSGGFPDQSSGTSFSAPYTAGLLALWRQYRQGLAEQQGKAFDLSFFSQDLMKDRLVVSSKPVIAAANTLAEPVLRCGGGVIQADALVENQLVAQPSLLSLPSNIAEPFTTTLSLSWEGPAHPDKFIAYVITHIPAYSVPLGHGWYGNDYATRKRAVSAALAFNPSLVVLDTTSSGPVQIQVTVSLPQQLLDQAQLYSGFVVLTPTSNHTASAGTSNSTAAQNCTAASNGTNNSTNCTTGATTNCTGSSYPVPPISVPYQGYARSYTRLRILAEDTSSKNTAHAAFGGTPCTKSLAVGADSLCYAPNSQPGSAGDIQDTSNPACVPAVCSGGFASRRNTMLNVSLAVLRKSPECSLRITLVPEVPLRWLNITVIDNQSKKVAGYLTPLYTGISSNSLATAGEIYSWCLGFNGFMSAKGDVTRRLQIGRTYRLKAFLTGPLAAADAAAGQAPGRQKVDIRGIINVVQ